MKSGSHSQQLKWSMGALKKGGSVNITTPETMIPVQDILSKYFQTNTAKNIFLQDFVWLNNTYKELNLNS